MRFMSFYEFSKGSDLLPRSELLAPRRTGCMSLQMEGEQWNLQAKPCNEKHPFICSKGNVKYFSN